MGDVARLTAIAATIPALPLSPGRSGLHDGVADRSHCPEEQCSTAVKLTTSAAVSAIDAAEALHRFLSCKCNRERAEPNS
jgi:hypothetical protein